jgi:putative membrane protein
MFLASALAVWLCATAPDRRAAPGANEIGAGDTGSTSAAGVIALLVTSMHMTLLGALLALAPRPLYHAHAAAALADQHLGGALMLAIGGIVYLGGGVALAATLVRQHAPVQPGLTPGGIRS